MKTTVFFRNDPNVLSVLADKKMYRSLSFHRDSFDHFFVGQGDERVRLRRCAVAPVAAIITTAIIRNNFTRLIVNLLMVFSKAP